MSVLEEVTLYQGNDSKLERVAAVVRTVTVSLSLRFCGSGSRRSLAPHLDDEGLGGGAAADDGLGRVAPLWPALVVQHGAGHGGGAGELDDPVAVQVVLPLQVLDG